MATLPDYLIAEQRDTDILQRMLATLPAELDRSEGSFLWDALAPAAIELALAAMWAQEVLRRSFASTTFGSYLDLRVEEHGLTRRPAVAATGTVTVSGAAGTLVPAGTRVSTGSTETVPAVVFETTEDATVGPGGTVDVAVRALLGGVGGNVAAGTITFLASAVAGLSGVTNAEPTSGGLEAEDDASLLARYLQKVRNPSAGGNKADYEAWALEVPGVGGVSVVPVRDGPGTVSVAIVDSAGAPASQSLVDAVQEYIAPPHTVTVEAEAMSRGGSGTSVDATLADDQGDSVKLVYSAGGEGTLTQASLDASLPQPGIWQLRLRVKVDSTAGASDLLFVGIWNASANGWAQTTLAGGVDASRTLRASDLSTSFGDVLVEFAWNGQDQLAMVATRLQADPTTVVWIDRAVYRSTFSRDDGEGKAPVGARVTVEAATAVPIDVSATLTYAAGYDPAGVRAAAEANIEAYLRSLAVQPDNDVRYARIANAILDTPGVYDYANLLVNGGVANLAIGEQQVAVKGEVALS